MKNQMKRVDIIQSYNSTLDEKNVSFSNEKMNFDTIIEY